MAPSEQVFLFTGENTYALTQKKRQWLQEFGKKHGVENIVTMQAAGCTYAELLDHTSVAPFLAEKRLVVLEGIPRFTPEQWAGVLENLYPATLLLIVSPEMDKRLSGTKFLREHARVEEFAPLSGVQLKAFVTQYASQQQLLLSAEALPALLLRTGDDQWTLVTEIQKLALYCGSRAATAQDVQLLCLRSAEQDKWELSKRLSDGSKAHMLAFMRDLEESGEGIGGMWNIFLWIASKATLMCAAMQEGVTSLPALVKMAGVPFPTAGALMAFCTRFPRAQLHGWVAGLAACDVQMKTGILRSSAEEGIELTVAAELLLLRACR